MQVGSLVKHKVYKFFAIATQYHHDNTWLVVRIDNTVCNWYYEYELEVLCE